MRLWTWTDTVTLAYPIDRLHRRHVEHRHRVAQHPLLPRYVSHPNHVHSPRVPNRSTCTTYTTTACSAGYYQPQSGSSSCKRTCTGADATQWTHSCIPSLTVTLMHPC